MLQANCIFFPEDILSEMFILLLKYVGMLKIFRKSQNFMKRENFWHKSNYFESDCRSKNFYFWLKIKILIKILFKPKS